MQAAMIGLAGLMLAGGIGWVSWLRVAAPRNRLRRSRVLWTASCVSERVGIVVLPVLFPPAYAGIKMPV